MDVTGDHGSRAGDRDDEATLREWRASSSRVQFMVKTIPAANKPSASGNHGTLVIRAYSTDPVSVISHKICSVTGIPQNDQRLVYSGKHLESHKSLSDYRIGNDSVVHVVSRIRSIPYPQVLETLDTLSSCIYNLLDCTTSNDQHDQELPCLYDDVAFVHSLFHRLFAKITPDDDEDDELKLCFDMFLKKSYVPKAPCFDMFLVSSVPNALVMLYNSAYPAHKTLATTLIEYFLQPTSSIRPHIGDGQVVLLNLRFCNMLRLTTRDPNDPLYLKCRTCLSRRLRIDLGCEKHRDLTKIGIHLNDLLPLAIDLASTLTRHFSTTDSPLDHKALSQDLSGFHVFSLPLRAAVKSQGPFSLASAIKHGFDNYGSERQFLHIFFLVMMKNMDDCLVKMEECLDPEATEVGRTFKPSAVFLQMLEDLSSLSVLFVDAQEKFKTLLTLRSVSVCYLITKYVRRRSEKCKGLVHYKDAMNYECRRHLAMMLLPEKKKSHTSYYEMLIDRTELLKDSFSYITRADRNSLHNGLRVEFKHEEAYGPGVLREWFGLVCQAIFNKLNALFVACPSNGRRFYPNPASKVNPLHLKYFTFCGRVMMLALMHEVQVGIALDRVFFLQLAGMPISLEDIRDADPRLYSSCKQILEMDADYVDTDELGLTFVREIEELGSRRVVELCPGGENLIVSSTNRERYVALLVENHFVTSTSEQVDHFAQGCADVLLDPKDQKLFFKNLLLEDLDCMLRGSEGDICVEDWKKHTDYKGCKEFDRHISRFWKVVGEMSQEQKKVLLFFWTSVKYLPIEGFRGLASRLQISKTSGSMSHLPSAHTCFYQLCFPAYRTYPIMKDRFRIITQKHVGCSFGMA